MVSDALLLALDFEERRRGSQHGYSRPDIAEIINLQFWVADWQNPTKRGRSAKWSCGTSSREQTSDERIVIQV